LFIAISAVRQDENESKMHATNKSDLAIKMVFVKWLFMTDCLNY